jgi:hypothetical protein
MAKIGVLLCQVDDPHKNSYFTHGLLLAIGIIAIAGEGFVAESNVNLSDSYDFSFSSTIKLSCDIVDGATLDSIKSSFLSTKVRKLNQFFVTDKFL